MAAHRARAVDARLSFDRAATQARARSFIALHEDAGIAREQVLIRIASTCEMRNRSQ